MSRNNGTKIWFGTLPNQVFSKAIEQIKLHLGEFIEENSLDAKALFSLLEVDFLDYCDLVRPKERLRYASYSVKRQRLILSSPDFFLQQEIQFEEGELGMVFKNLTFLFKDFNQLIIKSKSHVQLKGEEELDCEMIWLRKGTEWRFLFVPYLT